MMMEGHATKVKADGSVDKRSGRVEARCNCWTQSAVMANARQKKKKKVV